MKSQTISVLYQNESIPVDISKLYNSSKKFHELVQPYLANGGFDPQKYQLRILCTQFNPRNVKNFLRILQGQRNDSNLNEIPEICQVAKLFQADGVLNDGLTFYRQNADPNFSVLTEFSEANGEKYMCIENLNQLNSNDQGSSNLLNNQFSSYNSNNYGSSNNQFSSYNSNNYGSSNNQGSSYNSNNYGSSNNQGNSYNSNDQGSSNASNNQFNSYDSSRYESPNSSNNQGSSYDSSKYESPNSSKSDNSKPISVYYKIQVFNPPMKCCRYIFSKEGRILFTAKKKANEIYIGQGNDIHISADKKCCARIMQCDDYNIVYTQEQEFRINFVSFGVKRQFSIETSFQHGDKTLFWSPREIDINLNGEYNRVPIPSKKNMLLKNQNGSPTFVCRKMEKDVFEVECVSTIDPLIACAIGVSQIAGPYIKY